VEDVEQMFNVTKGEDGFDSTVRNVESQKPKDMIKIGIPKEYFAGGL
jgi:Asp-tRNA(Asn)/Glu-tRNA(Gln) amidotransferase A subunit family amidase